VAVKVKPAGAHVESLHPFPAVLTLAGPFDLLLRL